MEDKLKVLVWSDSPTSTTGFARVSREVLKGLHDTGRYDITVLGVNYNGTTPSQVTEMPDNASRSDRYTAQAYKNYNLIPANIEGDPYGRSTLLKILGNQELDILFIIQDTYDIKHITSHLEELKMRHGFKIIQHFPVDTPYTYSEFMDSMKIADATIFNNKWAYDLVKDKRDFDEERAFIAYYGVSDEDFYTISDEEKKEFRKRFFNGKVDEDDILIMRSDSNNQRKDWWRTFQIVANIAKDNDKIKFYANTEINKLGAPLHALSVKAGFEIGRNFLYIDSFTKINNLSQKDLNKLYNCADIGISTSRGEGCGFFHYEMLKLGKPLVLSDTTAHMEAINENAAFGMKAGDNPNFIEWMNNDMGMLREVTDYQDGVKVLREVVNGKRQNTRNIEKFMKNKTWNENVEVWVDIFDEIADRRIFIPRSEAEAPKKSKDTIQFQKIVSRHIEDARKEYESKYNKKAPKLNIF